MKKRISFKTMAVALFCLAQVMHLNGQLSSSNILQLEAQEQVITKDPAGKDPCRPIISPFAGYNFNTNFYHGVVAGVSSYHMFHRDCECDYGFGFLCWFFGPTYKLYGGYYPETKTADVSFSAGYRYILLYGEVQTGYSFNNSPEFGVSSFHIGPALGVELLWLGQLSLGYQYYANKSLNVRPHRFNMTLTVSLPTKRTIGGKRMTAKEAFKARRESTKRPQDVYRTKSVK